MPEYNYEQAAEYLGVSVANLKYHVRRGNLAGTVRSISGTRARARVFTKDELDAFDVRRGMGDAETFTVAGVEYYTLRGAGKYLGVSHEQVRQLALAGDLGSQMLVYRGCERWAFTQKQLDNYKVRK